MTMRNENAYETPAAVFIGLGLHKLFESLFLIVSKRSAAGHTAIYKVGVLSFILLTGCLGCQFTLLDYLTSPYVSPQYWLRDLQIANYGLNFVTSIVMAILFILCIRVFYKDNIKFMISMYAFFSLLVVFKGTGGLAGVIVGYDVASLKYDYLNHPLHHIIPFLLGFGQLFEAIFVTIGSIGYIYAKISDQDDSKPLIDHIIKADGIKFLLLVLVDWIISGFEIHSWLTGSYTYVTHVGLCNFIFDSRYGQLFFRIAIVHILEEFAYSSKADIQKETEFANE
ncbi:hypothetical protein HK103_000549 [Boothiomyces macroporosus]|uniref:Uncharacterized protein n=1 Tax=Boothiomyces macroporosus TaxID=261099 RepID=A0AAD5UMY8_9FUNG|nr:hypothetical protein HK103_000549 [Boothiomyces macroporosus]